MVTDAQVRLPNLEGTFYFSKAEWSKLFPETLVDALTKNVTAVFGDLYPLPPPRDLPVIVAVRMSLSFPGLLSAVPLHGVEHVSREHDTKARPVRFWFSDGGLISNFPIHFFDRVWPRWPTYAFDLCTRTTKTKPWLPTVEGPEVLELKPVESLPDFVDALLGAMQNWSDTIQSLLPGYRERIAHIPLGAAEGGLNLDMDAATVMKLSKSGEAAGTLFRRFDWKQHRWTRFVCSMREFSDELKAMHSAFDRGVQSHGAFGPLGPFLADYDCTSAHYSATELWRDNALSSANVLVSVIDSWDPAQTLADGPDRKPEPRPQLRIIPRY